MQRGNLVIYDIEGTVWMQTGEAEGSTLPHVYPVGLPCIEIPFGTWATKKLLYIDVSATPHIPVFEDIIRPKTTEELENEILLLSGVLG